MVLPALPDHCLALALDIGDTNKLSYYVLGLYSFYLTNPVSTTNTIPSIVMDVSAMFVDTTIFLVFKSYSLNTSCYYSIGRAEYRGKTINGF